MTAKKQQSQRGKKVKVKIEGVAQEAVTGVATGEIAGPKTFKLGEVRKPAGAGEQAIYRLGLKKKKDNQRVFKLLGRGEKLRASLSLTLTDAAGNSVTEKRVVRLTAGDA